MPAVISWRRTGRRGRIGSCRWRWVPWRWWRWWPVSRPVGGAGNVVVVSSKNEHDKLPIRMLHDRVLVRTDTSEGERRSTGGILIPATAAVGKRLAWADVVAVGQ